MLHVTPAALEFLALLEKLQLPHKHPILPTKLTAVSKDIKKMSRLDLSQLDP